jgi:hypothetical protein
MSVKRYNESEGTNKRRRKDPLLQNQEDKITEDFLLKNTMEQ